MPGEFERLDETVAPLAGPAGVAETAEAKMPVATLEEVFGAEVSQGDVIRADLRDARDNRGVIEVDERNAQPGARLPEGWRGVPTDDPVPFLVAQPVGVELRPGLVVQEGGPGPVRPLVVRDSLEHGGAFLKPGHEHEEHLGFHDGRLKEPGQGGKRERFRGRHWRIFLAMNPAPPTTRANPEYPHGCLRPDLISRETLLWLR